jgi:SAM-dependent methyltransferase
MTPYSISSAPTEDKPYRRIVAYYETCLRKFGNGPLAVNWKSERDAEIRYDIMLEVIRSNPSAITLLDFGCGLAALKDHIDRRGHANIAYSGLDLSPEFADAAARRHPESVIHCCDVLAEDCNLPTFDYVVMNGIFTRRHDLEEAEMTRYMHELCTRVFAFCRIGMAFNFMSQFVDSRDPALYYPSLADVAEFVATRLSRQFALRNDYGLFESTFYVYRGL